jgi:hypothetical protein
MVKGELITSESFRKLLKPSHDYEKRSPASNFHR